MLKCSYKGWVVALVFLSGSPVQASADKSAEREKIDFRGGSSLIFSLPLKGREAKTFGPGWKRAVLEEASGRETPLFPMESFASMGGVIFARDYSPRVSPSGRYAVLDVLRAGVVDPGPSGTAEDSGRQYCPVLDTASGCIVSMQAGELCGGNWSEKADEWIVTGYEYDATKAMIQYEFSGANELWNQFQKSVKLNGSASIRQHLVDSAGLINIMKCEPPNTSNRASYSLIARQLIREGDRNDAAYIEQELGLKKYER